RWVHPLCKPLETSSNGPFIMLSEKQIFTIDNEGAKISEDEGKNWKHLSFVSEGINQSCPSTLGLLKTKNNTIVLLYLDFKTYRFSWNNEINEPQQDCKLELWAIRSTNGGKTWKDKQKILDGYNADFFGFIQTRTGRILASVEHLVSNPARWVSFSIYSDDEGKTWGKSNIIDIGGHGHHSGAMEPTVAELNDGRLLMLIRTNLDWFWQAISDTDGKYWRTIMRSNIDASSAPGYLTKLQSGRLILVWNRVDPENQQFPRGLPNPQCGEEINSSWHREELSISFSEDDGKTWLKPIVIAKQKGQISYPYIFERKLGEVWITATWLREPDGSISKTPFRVKIKEEEFLKNNR
ncbi:MAG: sialidase family protein, partial [Candidatus Ratteibacteria bacterium]